MRGNRDEVKGRSQWKNSHRKKGCLRVGLLKSLNVEHHPWGKKEKKSTDIKGRDMANKSTPCTCSHSVLTCWGMQAPCLCLSSVQTEAARAGDEQVRSSGCGRVCAADFQQDAQLCLL